MNEGDNNRKEKKNKTEGGVGLKYKIAIAQDCYFRRIYLHKSIYRNAIALINATIKVVSLNTWLRKKKETKPGSSSGAKFEMAGVHRNAVGDERMVEI